MRLFNKSSAPPSQWTRSGARRGRRASEPLRDIASMLCVGRAAARSPALPLHDTCGWPPGRTPRATSGAAPDARKLAGLLPLSAEDVDDRLEGKPLGDLVAGAQHLTELGTRELLDLEALLLGGIGGHVLK